MEDTTEEEAAEQAAEQQTTQQPTQLDNNRRGLRRRDQHERVDEDCDDGINMNESTGST